MISEDTIVSCRLIIFYIEKAKELFLKEQFESKLECFAYWDRLADNLIEELSGRK